MKKAIVSQLTDSAKKRQQEFKTEKDIPAGAKKKLKLDVEEAFTSNIAIHKTESSTSVESLLSSKEKSSDYLSETTSTDEIDLSDYIKELSKKRILLVIENNSRFYLGLPQEIYFLVKLLCKEHVALKYLDVLLSLKKIRLNDPFLRLSIDFGVSPAYIQAAFRKAVPVMAAVMKQLIIWPSKETIIKLLPIAFRKRFSNVQSIIDCFEIEIEKPSNPQHQALTWSAYKSCNTIKYLISCTPHGCVNFISHGYGGRATDAAIVSDCGYLDVLPTECAVLADRGFKNVAADLSKKKCYLVRPPSVIQGTGLTKEEVRMSKRVAAVRIHIERVISRIREFTMLTPHATVDKNFINLLDFIVVIACAVINMQGTLIKH